MFHSAKLCRLAMTIGSYLFSMLWMRRSWTKNSVLSVNGNGNLQQGHYHAVQLLLIAQAQLPGNATMLFIAVVWHPPFFCLKNGDEFGIL